MRVLEEIQAAVADWAARNPSPRIITQDVLRERCQHYMEVAKKELEACGPEESTDSSKFCQTVTVFGPGGEEGNINVGFKGNEQKHARMYAISETCKALLAQAIILRIVGTTVNTERIAKAMELNVPQTLQQFEYFHEKMRRWMRTTYNTDRFGELPPDLRFDFIVVAGMGPTLEDCGLTCPYRWENGKLIFDDFHLRPVDMRIEMVPRWWE